jgi:hypothetical protein
VVTRRPERASTAATALTFGPDANPNEPGHQDANQKDEAATEGGSTGESESATDDGPNVGPDANLNEPGHQDADESGDATQN